LRNAHEVYLLVLARKEREPGPLPPPQQSDYAEGEWQRDSAAAVGGGGMSATREPSGQDGPGGAVRALASLGLLGLARRARERLRALRESGLALPAPDYRRIDVAELLSRRTSP
jgi:hypothetical protein